MLRSRLLLAALFLFASSGLVQGQTADGTWQVGYVSLGAFEQAAAIVKIQTRDGKVTGEMVAANPRIKDLAWKGVAQVGNVLQVTLTNGRVDLVLEAVVPQAAAKRVLGSFAVDGTLYPGVMTATEATEIDAKSLFRPVDCPPAQQARTLSQKPLLLRAQAARSTDADKKKDLLQQAAAAAQVAKTEVPKLQREVVAKHADSPAVFDVALTLIRSALTSDVTPEEIKSWAAASVKAAAAFGPRWQLDFTSQVASVLVNLEGMSGLAVDYANQAERALTPKSSAGEQAKILGVLARALKKSGKDTEAKTVSARLAKLDDILDREYLAKMPPFKGTPFPGRKNNSTRAVFLELFTGAMCPPCVAADLAFDVLAKTYKPNELVLIQYHMHIPGPDPLTNPDTEARWEYYTKTFPDDVRGVPSSLFNGKPLASGGGGIDNAEPKYQAYREVIDPLLELPAGAKLAAHAQQKGDRIDIQVEVADLIAPGAEKKLRILVAEESIRYLGSNKIRFHHHVVRAFPGGVDGKALMTAASKHTASLDLGALRGDLVKYLDDYETNKRPFTNPARPLDFNNLRVIAFVQDDNTREILQATQVEVEKK